jgi:hypothetical protein
MASIRFRSTSTHRLEDTVAELRQDLQKINLDTQLRLSGIISQRKGDVMRGEAMTWATVVMTAVGTAGTLTVLLSKDGVLVALAGILEKYVEGERVEVLIECKEGKKMVQGPISEIKEILKQIDD